MKDSGLTETEEHKEWHQPHADSVEHELVDLVEPALRCLLVSACSSVGWVPTIVVDAFLDKPCPPRNVVRREEEEHDDERRVGSGEGGSGDESDDSLKKRKG